MSSLSLHSCSARRLFSWPAPKLKDADVAFLHVLGAAHPLERGQRPAFGESHRVGSSCKKQFLSLAGIGTDSAPVSRNMPSPSLETGCFGGIVIDREHEDPGGEEGGNTFANPPNVWVPNPALM